MSHLKLYVLLSLALCATTLWAESLKPEDCARPDLVREVLDGKRTAACVSWWGFDENDSTRFLQSAIDSGVPVLTIDKQRSEWITTPLNCVSNQEIVFEEGVVLLAKAGEFKGTGDPMLRMRRCENVTIRGAKADGGKSAVIRMRKGDYHSDAYVQAEWRHGVSILSSKNILIQDLTIEYTGGDGIYLGVYARGGTCENVTIRRVDCNENNRQGISVISARNLLIEDTVMRNTNGTAPQAGIDFEPNHENEEITNCVMRRCLCENNAGDGYEFYLPNLTANSPKITITLEDCVSRGNRRNGVNYMIGRRMDESPAVCQNSLTVKNFVTENEGGYGMLFRCPQVDATEVVLENVVVRNPGQDAKIVYPIGIMSGVNDTEAVGNFVFRNVTVEDSVERAPLKYIDASANGFGLENVEGSLTCVRDGVKTVTELGDAWIRANGYHARDVLRLPLLEIPYEKLNIGEVQPWNELRAIPGLRARHSAEFLFYVSSGVETLDFSLQSRKVGRNDESPRKVTLVAPDGKSQALAPLPLGQEMSYSVGTATAPGLYRVQIVDSSHSFEITKSNVPCGLNSRILNLISTVGEFYIHVPQNAPQCGFRVFGSDAERVKVTIYDPAGEKRFEQDNVFEATFFYPEAADLQKGGVWKVRFDRPSVGVLEDFHLTIQGITPVVSLTPDVLR